MSVENMHFVPDHGLQIQEQKDRNGVYHLFRYWWAWLLARELKVKKIWDLGCGCGYGCRILREQLDIEVLGVDVDPTALNRARGAYQLPGVTYDQVDLDKVWTMEHKADCVVSFHTLEFLRNRALFLDRVANSLTEHGVFLFSTQTHTSAVYEPDWDRQQIIYDRQQVDRLLRRHFTYVAHAHDDKNFPAYEFRRKTRDEVGYPVGDNLWYCRMPIHTKDQIHDAAPGPTT